MQIVECFGNGNENASAKYTSQDGADNESLNSNKNPQNLKHHGLVSERYNPRFIINLLTWRDLRGTVFFHFDDKNDFIALSSEGQLNVRGSEDHLFKFWGNSEFRNIRPNTVFHKLEHKITMVDFTPFSGSRNLRFDSFGRFISWLEDSGTIPRF